VLAILCRTPLCHAESSVRLWRSGIVITCWNKSKIISRLNGLFGLIPFNMGDLVQQEHPELGGSVSEQKACNNNRSKIGPQERVANARVSAREPWYIGRNLLNRPTFRIAKQYQRQLYRYIVEKCFQCATISSLTVRVYLYSFSHCCFPNTPTSAKLWENLNLLQFKVTHKFDDFGTNRKRTYEFLLLIKSNFGPILHRFWDTATYWLKIAYFSYPSFIRRPCSLSSLWNFTAKLSVRKR